MIVTDYKVSPKTIEQEKALIKLMESLNIPFEKADNNRYNAEFNAKMQRGKQEIEEGKGIKMTIEDLENLCK